MHSTFIKLAAILGALAVALGAFGAHALKQRASEYALDIFETGVRYQFYHVIALLAAGILFREFGNKWMMYSGWLFVIGMLLFSGSLYLLTYIKIIDKPSLNWIGAITPLGGVAFIAGWICLLIGVGTK
ncbi:DUF423 domain-containing protein [Aridibaculum aurantiacum]|uniref:DUF423 domain-containing protein n=1 Tax=Aridibaculum aurantiacum TaxID=2810307 RepID=UPI001A9580E5|nr:DUF423 domain-containing protein [Aridibaculum aurantiacum]